MTLTIKQATEQFNTHTEKFLSLTADSSKDEVYGAILGAHILAQSSGGIPPRSPFFNSVQFRTCCKHINMKEYGGSDSGNENNNLARQVVKILTDAGVLESIRIVALGKLQSMPGTQ